MSWQKVVHISINAFLRKFFLAGQLQVSIQLLAEISVAEGANIDRTHFDAPEIRREDVNDIFGKANVL